MDGDAAGCREGAVGFGYTNWNGNSHAVVSRLCFTENDESAGLRGDCNDDGAVDISDAIFALRSLFRREGKRECDDACDSNDDGTVDISDAIHTVFTLFLSGVIPPRPLSGASILGRSPGPKRAITMSCRFPALLPSASPPRLLGRHPAS